MTKTNSFRQIHPRAIVGACFLSLALVPAAAAAAEPERVGAMRRRLRPWIELGKVEPDTTFHLDDAALEQLRALGYLGD